MAAEGDDMEHPDDIPRRREDDDRLLPRLGSDIAYWWEISGWMKRVAALAGIAVGLATCSYNVGMGAEMVRAEWQDVPARVTTLENRFEARQDSTLLPLRQRVDRLDVEVDTLRARLSEVRDGVQTLGVNIQELQNMAEWNNCLLRVQAGEQSEFECGPNNRGGGEE